MGSDGRLVKSVSDIVISKLLNWYYVHLKLSIIFKCYSIPYFFLAKISFRYYDFLIYYLHNIQLIDLFLFSYGFPRN